MFWFYFTIIFIAGAVFGSFLNACVWRKKQKKSIAKGRSVCTSCKNKILWFDNIPIISFFILKGRCRSCKEKISYQYPLVELWLTIAFIFVFLIHSGLLSNYILILRDCFVVWVLSFIFIYDFEYQEIPDSLTLIPAGLIFVFSLFFGWHSWHDMIIGAVVAAGFFFLQFFVSKGKWIGGGDVRLGVLIGVILGWQKTILALMLAYIFGAVIGVFLILTNKKKITSEIAFGTFLAIATFVVMFFGEHIIGWYFNLIY